MSRLRSVLYLPASNERALDKARTLACDALILDLEDAVAADAKVLARERAVTAAGSSAYGARIVAIRCNGLDTPWGAQDLVALARAGAGAVVVPKVGGASDVDRYVEALRSSGAPDDLAVWPMVETPRAVVALKPGETLDV